MKTLLVLLALSINGPLSVSKEETFSFKEHQAIELFANLEIPENFKVAKIQWRTRDSNLDLRPHDQGTNCSIWGPPGEYEITLDAWMIDWENKKFESIEKIFNIAIEGSRPPPKVVDNNDNNKIVPLPPDEETSGEAYSIVIRNADELNVDQTQALLEIRSFVNDEPSRFTHLEFAPDAENVDGTPNKIVSSYVKKIPKQSSFPYGFVVQKNGNGETVIKWQGEVTNSKQVIDLLKDLN